MAAVADLERFLERVFERTSARVFRARIQTVQVERRVERVMESARSGHGQTVVVPWRFRVRLHLADLDDLAAREGGADALAERLAANALTFARAHSYHLARKPMIDVAGDLSLERGRIEVDAVADAPGVREQPAPRPAPVAAIRMRPGPTPTTAVLAVDVPEAPAPAKAAEPAQPAPPEPVVVRAAAPEAPEPTGPRLDAGHAAGLRKGIGLQRVAVLRVTDPLGRDRLVEVSGSVLTIGRGTECGLPLPDAKASRLHGRLEFRHGSLWYTDLGSRNGSRVNGTVMDEAMLAVGDRLGLGDCTLVVESLPA